MKKFYIILSLLICLLNISTVKSQNIINQLTGGTVFFIEPAGKNLIAGTYGTIYISTNDGESWKGLYDVFKNEQYTTLYNTGTDIYVGNSSTNLYHSSDNGITWDEIPTLGLPNPTRFNGFTKYDDNLFAATNIGVFSTSDNGKTWAIRTNGLTNTNVRGIVSIDKKLYVATQGGGVFKSEDNGINWVQANDGVNGGLIWSIYKSGSTLFISGPDAVYFSTDEAVTWSKYKPEVLGDQVYNIFNITDNELIFNRRDTILISSDGGETWIKYALRGINNNMLWCIAKKGDSYFIGTQYGVFKSIGDGNNWVEKNAALTNVRAGLTYDGKNLFAITERIYKSSDMGKTWKIIYSDSSQVTLRLSFFYGNYYLVKAGFQETTILISTDEGETWDTFNSKDFISISPTAFIQLEGKILCGTFGNGLYISEDTLKTFQRMVTGTPIDSSRIYTIIKAENYLFAGTYGKGILRSSDNGQTWEYANNGYNESSASRLKYNGKYLFTCTYFLNKVFYYSSDLGDNWVESTNGIPDDASIRDIATNGDTVYIATLGAGIFISYNNGLDWMPMYKSKGVRNATQLLLIDDNLFITTWGDGGYQQDMPASVDMTSNETVIVFPNPAKDYIRINLTDELLLNPVLEVYNIYGEHVSKVSKEFDGKNSILMNLNGLGTGTYFIRIKNNNNYKIGKFEILR